MRVAVTGANGHLGRRLLNRLAAAGHAPIAIVRSESAAGQVRSAASEAAVHVTSYADTDGLAQALAGADAAVHLVGIIREISGTSFEDAHVAATQALLSAARTADLRHIIYYSLLGADARSRNRCLATRGVAEDLFIQSGIDTTVFRVGMVLGEGDYATASLAARAVRSVNFAWRAGSLEQPIDAADLIEATIHRLESPLPGVHDIAGPESMPRAELIRRVARLRGRSTRVVSLPIGVALGIADLLGWLMASPPVSRAMLEVLDHDDQVDVARVEQALGITLTPVADTLERVI